MRKTNLLINEPPLQVLPSLAIVIGLNEAIALQQLHYWLNNPKIGKEIDGHKWVYNNYDEWQRDNFPFWSVRTVQRVFLSLEKIGVVISTQPESYDRTKYYRIDYDKLAQWTTADCVNPECQDGTIEDDNLAHSSLTETTTETTTERESPTLSFSDMKIPEAMKVPTLKLYRKATGALPGSAVWEFVHNFITEHALTEKQIREASIIWCARGYNRGNVEGILEWARDGVPQKNGNGHKPTPAVPQGAAAAAAWLAKKQAEKANV